MQIECRTGLKVSPELQNSQNYLSFQGTIQHVLSFRDLGPPGRDRPGEQDVLLRLVAHQIVPYRPHRIEPRVRKRRPKNYRLMTRPRSELQAMQRA